VENIREYNNHLNTGFLGTQFLLQTLSDHGFHDVAYTLATHSTYPSWGYMIEKGATTIWENWNADTKGPEMNSRNHPPFAVIGEWMYAYLGGIKPDEEYPGFKRFVIEPRPVGDLNWVKAEYKSPYGKIVSNWELKDDRFIIDITIPANSMAKVIIPTKDAESIKESGVVLTEFSYAEILSEKDGTVEFLLEAGNYRFITVY
jgi:alpha-L-rhamnosidase